MLVKMKKITFVIFALLQIVCAMSQNIPSFSTTVTGSLSTGYYFCSPVKIGAGSTSFAPLHLILDDKGGLVYYKYFNGNNTGDFKLQANGCITYSRLGKFYVMDSTFTLKDSVSIKNNLVSDGHDLQILSNGHYLLLGAENVTMDLSSYHLFNGSDPGSSSAIVKCGVIQEQDANKNVVFEWHSKDHFNFTDVDPAWLTNPNNVDWTHLNAVEQDVDGNFLLSVRHFNEITKIKRSDSSIIWRLGGSANQYTFINDPNMFKAQHDVRRIGNGNLTLFDNGSASPLHSCNAKEYQLDENSLTASLVWNYNENSTTYSRALGNVQRLPNGNTLINYGMLNNRNQMFNVVTSAGIKVFEIIFSDTLRSYRAFNYPSLPWALKRPVISCNTSGGQTYLDAGAGYGSYLWSNGATTQTISVSSTGAYTVWVSKGQGGFISSEKYTITDLANPCAISLDKELQQQAVVNVSPNPFTDAIHLSLDQITHSILNIDVFDLSGQKLYSERKSKTNHITIKTENLEPGIYFLKVNDMVKKIIKY